MIFAGAEIREEEKVAAFVSYLGHDGRVVFRTLFPYAGDSDREKHYASLKMDEVLKKFREHCLKQLNPVAETHVLNKIVQQEGESFGEFLTRLRVQVVKCAFACECGKSTQSRAIRDKIVEGIRDRNLRLKLLGKKDLTEEAAIDTCKAFEAAASDCKQLDGDVERPLAVAAVQKRCFKCKAPWDKSHR